MRYTRDPKSRSMTFMATEELYQWLNNRSKHLDISVGQLVRQAVLDYQARVNQGLGENDE